MTITIWFGRGKGLLSKIARLALLSPWDRVAIDFNDGYVFESTIPRGVIVRSMSSFVRDVSTLSSLTLTNDDLDYIKARRFVGNELNKQYDWLTTFNLPTTTKYSLTHWLSSELIAQTLNDDKVILRLSDKRVTPFDLWCSIIKYVSSRDGV